MIPPRCGNWAHIPWNVANHQEAYEYLKRLGFRIVYNCGKFPGWYHIHPPKGWKLEIEEAYATLRDAKGRERVLIFEENPRKGTLAEVRVLHYYIVHVSPSIMDGMVVIECEYRDPDDNIVYRGFTTIDARHHSEVNVSRLIRILNRRFAETHPDASNPLAYWDD